MRTITRIISVVKNGDLFDVFADDSQGDRVKISLTQEHARALIAKMEGSPSQIDADAVSVTFHKIQYCQ
jgi:hypothetical protein